MEKQTQGPRQAIPFPEELGYLKKVTGKVAKALARAEQDVQRHQKNYGDFMAYISAHRADIDPREIFQSEGLLEQEGFAGMFALENRDRLARVLASPYFARIDFKGDEKSRSGVYYVGRATFQDENGLYVLDWRAPAASMFYDFELGRAWFNSPEGRVEGMLTRKRQFKIAGGEMEYALESSLTIQDDVLQKELSSTSDEKMRSIIATIQKEQNLIIRDEAARVMVIQGVAGSGKTSIALHRIAYLLYRFKDTLSAENVVILSPNRVFSDHIANVLPELGEQPVYQMGFAQLARIQLEEVIGFYPEPDPLETTDAAWAERTRYKGTAEFLQKLDEYIAHAVKTVFTPADYTFGPFVAEKVWIASRYAAYARYPIKRRVREIADDILDRFTVRNVQQEELPKRRDILKGLNAMLHIRTSRNFYKAFYRWLGKPRYLVIKKGSLEYADVYPFLYLHAAFEGLRENHRIRHVVVDEMQDYAPVQLAVLQKLFDCKMTILGDFSQAVDPHKSHTLQDLLALYPGAQLMRLQKSYRSTTEIIEFAGKIKPDADLRAVERHGPPPEVLPCADWEAQVAKVRELARVFQAGPRNTLGILLKNNADAAALHAVLAEELEISLVTPESERFTAGVSVMSIGMSKGLEFDEVILPDADDAHYSTGHDKSLLYVACTRAMHRLTLLHPGQKSRLLP